MAPGTQFGCYDAACDTILGISCLGQLMVVPRESRGLDFGNIGGSLLASLESSPTIDHRYLPRSDGALVDLLGAEAGGYVGRLARLVDGRVVIATGSGLLAFDGGRWRKLPVPTAMLTPQHDVLAVTSSGVVVALHRKMEYVADLLLLGPDVNRRIRRVTSWSAVADGGAIELFALSDEPKANSRSVLVTLEPSVRVEDPAPEAPRVRGHVATGDELTPVVVGSGPRRWVEVRTPAGEVRRRVFAPCVSGACEFNGPALVALSREGEHLLVGSGPDTVTHVALETGVAHELRVPGAAIRSAGFAEGDTRVITGSSDGFVRLWYLDAHEAIAAARARGIGPLLPEDMALLPGLFPEAAVPTPTREEEARWSPQSSPPAPMAPPPGDPSGAACGGAGGCG